MEDAMRPIWPVLVPYILIVARLCLAAVFLFSGFDKARHWGDGVREVAGLGLPLPPVFTALTIATQLLGGLMIVFNVGAWIGAGLLAAFTVIATVLGHRFWLSHGARAKRELTTSLEHLAIVGGLLLLAAQSLGAFH